MMRRRASVTLLAGVLLAGLVAVPGGPADAQVVFGPLELDSAGGAPGATVGAQVDTAVVAEECATTVDEMIPQFYAGEGSQWSNPGPVFADFMAFGPLIGIEPPADGVWPQLPPPFPSNPLVPPAGVDPQMWSWQLHALARGSSYQPPWVEENQQQNAAVQLWVFMQIMGGYVNQPEAQEAYLGQTFILSFADLETEEPVGAMSNFDPHTGQGQIEVPDLEPGLWPVIATCVAPVITEESFMAAVDAGAAVLEAHDVPLNFANPTLTASACIDPLTAGGSNPPDCNQLIVEAVAAAALPELMQPVGGPWVDLYCILQEDGFCATPPDPVGLLAELSDEELAEFADLEAGDGAGDGDADPDGLAVEPVSASPAFTG